MMSLVSERIGNVVQNLPNLKIEIENDQEEKMETDDDSSVNNGDGTVFSETEEGELVDEDDRLDKHKQRNKSKNLLLENVPVGRSILKYDTKEYLELQQQASVKNPNGAFVTGVNIFSPEEQVKLEKRAQRFGIEASDAKVLTEKLLKKLYKSMGVKPSNKDIRVEALHMRGTEEMTTQDVFDYFKDYGPASLEWITDNSCNVVWLDDVSSARALLGLSLHISGQTSEDATCQSNSDIEMESQAVHNDSDCLSEESDAVAVDDLGVELPPGRWRRGAPYPLSPCILLRFATTNDRSSPRPGFTKFGSHQFGRYVGLISESRKRRMQGRLPAPVVFDDVGDESIPKPGIEDTDNANPWGILAKTWSQFDKARKPRPPSPIIERVIPIPSGMTPPPCMPVFTSRPRLVARTRIRRERENQAPRRVSVSEDGSTDNEEWQSRSKMPRMRMHADDEEKKLEKRLKKSRPHRSTSRSPGRKDLRHRIRAQISNSASENSDVDVKPSVEVAEEEEEVPDLRVAVPADKSPSPEDSKANLRNALFQSGNVKSVLRGARGHSENDEDDEDGDNMFRKDADKNKSSTRRHRTRSRERRKHHRKYKREVVSHNLRKGDSDSDSEERTFKTVKSTIRKKSPDRKERPTEELDKRERISSCVVRSKSRRDEGRENRSPRHEGRHRHKNHNSEGSKKSRSRRHEHNEEHRSRKDLRSKLAHTHKSFDSNNEFRSKSPLQIEIDNDEYLKKVDSDASS